MQITEGISEFFSQEELSNEHALAIRQRYSKNVKITQDFADKDKRFEVLSKNYIGHLPVSKDFTLSILPKVRIANIFKMLECALKVESVKIIKGRVDVETLDDLSEALASKLALLVLERVRKGLYSSYEQQTGLLPFVRGRINVGSTLRSQQWPPTTLCCEYEEHTPDVEDNRILLWTLYRLRQLSFKKEEYHKSIRRAYQALNGSVSLELKEANECIGRSYNRLNDDYEPMHMLCSFFLQHLSPGIMTGARAFLPFTLYMPALFQSFVLELLREYFSNHIIVKYEEEEVKATVTLTLKMDVVLRDALTNNVIAVIDAKYKRDQFPSNQDIFQIVTYAHYMNSPKAILVYPSSSSEYYKAPIRDINVQTVVCDISQDDLGQKRFCHDLAQALET